MIILIQCSVPQCWDDLLNFQLNKNSFNPFKAKGINKVNNVGLKSYKGKFEFTFLTLPNQPTPNGAIF